MSASQQDLAPRYFANRTQRISCVKCVYNIVFDAFGSCLGLASIFCWRLGRSLSSPFSSRGLWSRSFSTTCNLLFAFPNFCIFFFGNKLKSFCTLCFCLNFFAWIFLFECLLHVQKRRSGILIPTLYRYPEEIAHLKESHQQFKKELKNRSDEFQVSVHRKLFPAVEMRHIDTG